MMKRLILAMVVLLSVSVSASAETSVWKVERNGSLLYLGGTCHVLRESDYPLPEEFTKAFNDSQVVVFETDIGSFAKPETQAMLITKGMYDDGRSLDKVLSSKTYGLLSRHCESMGLPIASLNQFKPPVVVLTLVFLELQKMGVSQTGADTFFHRKATEEHKKIEWLESVQEQIDFILSMGKGKEDRFVEHSLKDMKRARTVMDSLIAAWKTGNEEQLARIFTEEMKDDPDIYKSMVVDRNRRWLPHVEHYLQTDQREFILVGAGHLVGPDGILQLLKARGYKISKLR